MRKAKLFSMVLAVVLALGVPMAAMADATDDITVNYSTSAITELEVDVASVTLAVDSATAGSAPNDDTDSTTADYAVTTNTATTTKVTASLGADMPADTGLYVTFAAPSTGVSAGEKDVSLATTEADVVTSIDAVNEGSLDITFRLTATVAAGPTVSGSPALTVTLVAE